MTDTKNKITSGMSLIDESLDPDLTINYYLSLQVGMDGLGFCVFDSRRNKYLALQTYNFQGVYNCQMLCESINNLVKQNDLLKNVYRAVHCALIGSKSTIIPLHFFEAGFNKDYLKFNHSLEENEVVADDSLPHMNAKNLFAIPQPLESTLKKIFPNATINHHSTVLLESILSLLTPESTKQIFAHIQLSHFEVIVTEGKKLVFYNSFSYQTSEDFIYFLLFVFEQLKLNPENHELVLLGEVERNSAIYSILQKYVRHVAFGERPTQFDYSYKFNNVPKHFYYCLLNQYACAS